MDTGKTRTIESSKPMASRHEQSRCILSIRGIRLTKKAEPPPTNGVNRDSGTASANGGWLRRLVRRRHLAFIQATIDTGLILGDKLVFAVR